MSSEEEFNAAGDVCSATNAACWIGLLSAGGSLDWSWTDGSALDFGFHSDGTPSTFDSDGVPNFDSLPWNGGEPNDDGYDEDCVEFQTLSGFDQFGFNDASCDNERFPLCRKSNRKLYFSYMSHCMHTK